MQKNIRIDRAVKLLRAWLKQRYCGKGKCWQDWYDTYLKAVLDSFNFIPANAETTFSIGATFYLTVNGGGE